MKTIPYICGNAVTRGLLFFLMTAQVIKCPYSYIIATENFYKDLCKILTKRKR